MPSSHRVPASTSLLATVLLLAALAVAPPHPAAAIPALPGLLRHNALIAARPPAPACGAPCDDDTDCYALLTCDTCLIGRCIRFA